MRIPAFALCLAAGLSGCATTDAVTTVRTEGNAPAGVRLTAPVIVADDARIELVGEELTPEARARFLRERTDRISDRAQRAESWWYRPLNERRNVSLMDVEKIAVVCVPAAPFCAAALVVGAVTMPVTLISIGAIGQTIKGVTYVGGSLFEPSLRLSPERAARIAATVSERATSAELVERALYTAPRDFVQAEEAESRLVVRMKAARNCELDGEAAICLVAEARAVLQDGTVLPPTLHVFVHGPLEQLARDGAHLERTLDQALDLLAESIVAIYTGSGPLANLPQEDAPRPAPAEPAGLRKFTQAEASVFPKTSAGVCVREGC